MRDSTHMAIDQRGTTYHDLGPHPRAELLRRLHRKSAHKMYVDRKSGGSKHIGYVIAGLWLRVYKVQDWEGGSHA